MAKKKGKKKIVEVDETVPPYARRLPRTVLVDGYEYGIRWANVSKTEDKYGYVDFYSHEIFIDNCGSEVHAKTTLLHEILHACHTRVTSTIAHGGLTVALETEEELSELIVRPLESPLRIAIRDNPKIFAWIGS